jgi:hypothetical protein|tara:strand:+ start:7765 stop:8349 length:585 start_codon:yes stop_codon:yes gene_type:complete
VANLPIDVQQALKRQAPKALKQPFSKDIRKKFNQIKKDMIKEFLGLPVTRELLQGPGGANISGTLDGVSNLFAFIGFDRGDQPILPIIELLESTSVQFTKNIKEGNQLGNLFTVSLPTAQNIFAVTPMPWAMGRSWAQGIETGISGLGFLLRKNKGRSGAAIQTRVKVRGGKFRNTTYVSSFIKRYEKRFKELK